MNAHLDFDLRFETDPEGGARARMLNSPQGQDSAPLESLPAALPESESDAAALRVYGTASVQGEPLMDGRVMMIAPMCAPARV